VILEKPEIILRISAACGDSVLSGIATYFQERPSAPREDMLENIRIRRLSKFQFMQIDRTFFRDGEA
jgi:hypothetical protein